MEVITASNITDKRLLAFTTCAPADYKGNSVQGEKNRRALEQSLAPLRLAWLNLEHADVLTIDPPEATSADAVIITEPGHAAAFTTADCLPLIVSAHDHGRARNTTGEPRKQLCIAGIHAGWRGLASGVIEKTILYLSKELGYAPQSLHAWIGPSIKFEDYEVGEDAYKALKAISLARSEHFFATRPQHWLADLPGLATAILVGKGIPAEHIARCPLSSYQSPQFHSYRRDARLSGRMATIVGIKQV